MIQILNLPILRLRFLYKKLHLQRLRYTLPFLVLIAYTVLGAYIFRYLELDADEQNRIRYRENAEYAFKQTLNRMLEVRCQDSLDPTDQTLQARHVKEHLFWLMDYLNLTQVIEERSESSPWTWMGAMFYAGQLYTTIGYGLPATQTPGGRLASIVYIMIGIPLFLIILAEVGKLLSRGLRKLYKRVHKMKRLPEAARKMSEPMRALYQLTYTLASTAIGPAAEPMLLNGVGGQHDGQQQQQNEVEKTIAAAEAKRAEELKKKHGSNEQKHFPIPWALTILIVWIMFSAALFCIWETEWGYMTSIYFFFVSISTVGLGDLVPTKPDMMIVNFFMILIGLALLSMCVNLIQEALEKLIERLIEQYIDEIEKIAAVVTNTDTPTEFTEELEPFDVSNAELLKVPLTTTGGEEPEQKVSSIRQTVKDWFAERASNMLLNKIYPEQSDSESSTSASSESESDEEEDGEVEQQTRLEEIQEEDEEGEEQANADELQAVVVINHREPTAIRGKAKCTVHRGPTVHKAESVSNVRKSSAVSFGNAVEGQQNSTLMAQTEGATAGTAPPMISIHEGTPPDQVALLHGEEGGEEQEMERAKQPFIDELQRQKEMPMPTQQPVMPKRVSIKKKTTTMETKRISIAVSLPPDSESVRKKKAAKKPPKVPKYYAGALLKYSAQTMHAIQAVELAKLHASKSNDFKSRLFAKFATNQRFAQIVECNAAPAPKQMVSSSIQTSPVQSPLPPGRRSWRLRRMGCGVESMDSTSSDVNLTTTSRTNDASCSMNDVDSLYSNTYFDMCFGNYDTDSVPALMAQPNTPDPAMAAKQQTLENALLMGEPLGLIMAGRKFSEKLAGLFGRIMPGQLGKDVADGGDIAEDGEDGQGIQGIRTLRKAVRPPADVGHALLLHHCHSTPSTPTMAQQQRMNVPTPNDDGSNAPSIPNTPLILLTEPTLTERLRLSLTPTTSPAEPMIEPLFPTPTFTTPLPTQQQHQKGRHTSKQQKMPSAACQPSTVSSNFRRAQLPPPLASHPLHHRTLSMRRRFTISNSMQTPVRCQSLTALNGNDQRPEAEFEWLTSRRMATATGGKETEIDGRGQFDETDDAAMDKFESATNLFPTPSSPPPPFPLYGEEGAIGGEEEQQQRRRPTQLLLEAASLADGTGNRMPSPDECVQQIREENAKEQQQLGNAHYY